jgi:hypothetical protein
MFCLSYPAGLDSNVTRKEKKCIAVMGVFDLDLFSGESVPTSTQMHP